MTTIGTQQITVLSIVLILWSYKYFTSVFFNQGTTLRVVKHPSPAAVLLHRYSQTHVWHCWAPTRSRCSSWKFCCRSLYTGLTDLEATSTNRKNMEKDLRDDKSEAWALRELEVGSNHAWILSEHSMNGFALGCKE